MYKDKTIKLSITLNEETHQKLLEYMRKNKLFNKSKIINKMIEDYFLPKLYSENNETNLQAVKDTTPISKTIPLNGYSSEKNIQVLQKGLVYISNSQYVSIRIDQLTKMNKIKYIFYLLRLKKVLQFIKKDI